MNLLIASENVVKVKNKLKSISNRASFERDASQSNMSYRTLSALLWTFSGKGVQFVLQTGTIIILARLLTPADFGVVAAASTIVAFSEIFALLGVGPAIVQRPQLEERHLRTGLTFSVIFAICLTMLIWFAAPLIAGFYHSDKVISVLRTMIIVFPLSGITVVSESLMQRELQFRKLIGIEVASYTIGNGMIGISLAFFGLGVWALVIAYLVQQILQATALLVFQPHPKKPQFDVQACKELFYFGGGLTIARAFNYFGSQGDYLVVGRWLGMDALGLYGRAYQLMAAPANLLGGVLDRVLFPAMAKVQDESKRLVTAYRRGTALIALLILPLSVVLFVLAPELIDILLGPAWIEVVPAFQILVIGMLFRISYKVSISLARAKGAIYRNAWRQGVYAGLMVSGAWIGQHWGISGVALGVLVALVIHCFIMTQFGLSLIPFTWKQWWAIHVPAMWCAIIVGPEAWIVARILRDANQGSIIIVSVCSVVTMATFFALVRLVPMYILGTDGVWVVRTLLRRVPVHPLLLPWLMKESKEFTEPIAD